MPNSKTVRKIASLDAPIISTESNTRLLFNGRTSYKLDIQQYFNPAIPTIDTWYNSSLYGKVDLYGNPVFVKQQYLKNLSFNSGINYNQYHVLDFVAEAFKQLKNEVDQKIRLGKVKKTPVLNLIAKGISNNLSNSYFDREKFIINTFVKNILSYNKFNNSIQNFNSLIKIFIDYNDIFKNLRITKSNHLLSYKTSINVSGLVIDLSNGNPNDDVKKYEDWFSDENFKYFQTVCYKYGFLLDINIPSRLIFVPTLPQSIKFLQLFNMNNIEEMFNIRYEKSYLIDFINLKNLLLKIYVELVKIKPFIETKKICGVYKKVKIVKSKKISRSKIIKSSIDKKYDNLFWIKFYFYIFLKENEVFMSQNKFDSFIKNIVLSYKISEESCLKYLQTICCGLKKINVSGSNLNPSSVLTDQNLSTILKENGYKFYL